VLASSATAAPPAQALPRPLVPFSVIWIPDARTALEVKTMKITPTSDNNTPLQNILSICHLLLSVDQLNELNLEN
jgi:hypothetical protein